MALRNIVNFSTHPSAYPIGGGRQRTKAPPVVVLLLATNLLFSLAGQPDIVCVPLDAEADFLREPGSPRRWATNRMRTNSGPELSKALSQILPRSVARTLRPAALPWRGVPSKAANASWGCDGVRAVRPGSRRRARRRAVVVVACSSSGSSTRSSVSDGTSVQRPVNLAQ